ncbi:hypothetical protein ULMA_16020 [Patiriisocius marinus]|uniref:Uncharacterized protein n=1 Tax=Patiriisocius marinus TaxID=1397112 RepID=A0A5J4IX16_9FLAO|nr:grasp-with-spasm system ATP-grasp peptide maturase [Patiriisocius marinus]GER59494.1 hypothetical protein ULMA_16020 [Patiriisocius marinus]
MILIISIQNDFTTTYVMRWLNSMQKKFIRINEDDKLKIESLTEDDFILKTSTKKISFSEIDSVWYRRGDLFFKNDLGFDFSQVTKKYNNIENRSIAEYIFSLLKTKKSINGFEDNLLNKLEVLRYCKFNKINMPSFLITQSKIDLIKFYKNNCKNGVISKSIRYSLREKLNDSTYLSYSYKLNSSEIDELPLTFVPTFFQSYIPKKFEIRAFYLKDNFFSMAIFSQNNPKTKVDFRHYDLNKPNRESPYTLNKNYEKLLKQMLENFKIDCASLDIILTLDNEYYLLDINPIGQFGMTSKPCNYHLEKKIAEYL